MMTLVRLMCSMLRFRSTLVAFRCYEGYNINLKQTMNLFSFRKLLTRWLKGLWQAD